MTGDSLPPVTVWLLEKQLVLPSTQADRVHPAPSLRCTISPLLETQGGSFHPQHCENNPISKHSHSLSLSRSGKPIHKYTPARTHSHTSLDPLLNPLPTLLLQGTLLQSCHSPLNSCLSTSLETHVYVCVCVCAPVLLTQMHVDMCMPSHYYTNIGCDSL